MNVDLPADARQFVEGLIASGQFESADEALAEGVRLLMGRQGLRADCPNSVLRYQFCLML